MLRLTALFTLLQICVTQNKNGAKDLSDLFTNDPKPVSVTSFCDEVVGSSRMCIDCYTCDHENVKNRSSVSIKLRNRKCEESKVCCIIATDYKTRQYDDCGKSNPQGLPRTRRTSLNAVLEREFPWRARVYSASRITDVPLCDATYIGYKIKALVTTASCVNKQLPNDLVVKFTENQPPNQIRDIIIHPQFNKASHKNDIALLLLSERPDHVSVACVSEVSPDLGTPCYTVSRNETIINLVIPEKKFCRAAINNNTDIGLMCAQSLPLQGEAPEGAGIFCTEQLAGRIIHVLHGVSLNVHKENLFSVHTNITNFVPWMDSVGNNHTHTLK